MRARPLLVALVALVGSSQSKPSWAQAKIASSWSGDVGDMAGATALGGAVGLSVGLVARSNVADVARTIRTQVATTLFLSRVGIIRIEWTRIRRIAGYVASTPLRLVQWSMRMHHSERLLCKEAELERCNQGLEGTGSRQAAAPSLNLHAAAGGLGGLAAGFSLLPLAQCEWPRLRGGWSHRGAQPVVRCGATCRLRSSRCRPCAEANEDGPAARRTVGQVVKGVHGGKYQFSSGGFETFAGNEFASALAASGSTEDRAGADSDEEAWPTWATELLRPRGGAIGEVADDEVVCAPLGPDGRAVVRITNVYRSWERFYVSCYADDAADGCAANRGPMFAAAPVSGDLAPRGGANNVCDESRPYLDHVEITVHALRPGAGTILVRTEEEQWVFRLVDQFSTR